METSGVGGSSPAVLITRTVLAPLLRPPLAVYGWVRSLVRRMGALEHRGTAGFTVHESGDGGGAFAVTSRAEPQYQWSELADLAGSLRAAGYLVQLGPGGEEPRALVSVRELEPVTDLACRHVGRPRTRQPRCDGRTPACAAATTRSS